MYKIQLKIKSIKFLLKKKLKKRLKNCHSYGTESFFKFLKVPEDKFKQITSLILVQAVGIIGLEMSEKMWNFGYAFEREIGRNAENDSGLIILNMRSREIRVNVNNLGEVLI